MRIETNFTHGHFFYMCFDDYMVKKDGFILALDSFVITFGNQSNMMFENE
ncbi:hypothetical protein VAE122_3040372 [Vibrio aestuarianus]|nr:hypothetical protein VAE122_3040372 [Vibrio aestuarianus]